jgi:hypothetical protein
MRIRPSKSNWLAKLSATVEINNVNSNSRREKPAVRSGGDDLG